MQCACKSRFMEDLHTQTLTFYDDTGGQAFAGFRVGQAYALTYSEEGDVVAV